ncbi:hypothetical protein LXL04_033625 [Taraxacum kok-saghyz]
MESLTNVRDIVEVMSREDGFKDSYFASLVVEISFERCRVRYGTFIQEDGSPLSEVVSFRKVQPYPPPMVMELVRGDIVVAWYNEGWWMG